MFIFLVFKVFKHANIMLVESVTAHFSKVRNKTNIDLCHNYPAALSRFALISIPFKF